MLSMDCVAKGEKEYGRPRVFWVKVGLAAALCMAAAAHAQTASTDTEEQRLRAREQAREREQRQREPDVRYSTGAESVPGGELPRESPCYDIRSIALDVPADLPENMRVKGASALPMDPFHFVRQELDGYAGQCIGREGIGLILRRVTASIVGAGYTTTRVGLPEQNLNSGTLQITLVPGVIRAIRFADAGIKLSWASAFPVGPGDLLNLRDLEQGLEQLKRVPSQDAEMEIVPGDIPGESDVVVKLARGKPWRMTFSLDDSGSTSTGKRQLSVNYSYDNIFGLNDLFYLGYNQDMDQRPEQRGTYGTSLHYSVPWGLWTFSWQSSDYNYHQKIAGINQSFESSGKSTTHELKIQRLLGRDQVSKTSLQFRTYQRSSRSYIDDTEILVQRRDAAAAELALLHRRYIGNAQLDISFAERQGMPWYGAQKDKPNRDRDGPTHQYRLQILDVALQAPFKIAGINLRYSGVWHGQYTRDRLYLSEDLSIGNRYTVRGFDGEQTLAAENGYYWRNELQMPLGDSGQSIYVGMDRGRVFGPNVANLLGNKLAGAVLGVRGGGYGASYDLFIAAPLHSSALPTKRPVTGFSLAYQF